MDVYVRQSVLCILHFAISSMLCNRCYAIFALRSMLCNLCYTSFNVVQRIFYMLCLRWRVIYAAQSCFVVLSMFGERFCTDAMLSTLFL
jgi:hypothetical protein